MMKHLYKITCPDEFDTNLSMTFPQKFNLIAESFDEACAWMKQEYPDKKITKIEHVDVVIVPETRKDTNDK
jgi:hypothetical protein